MPVEPAAPSPVEPQPGSIHLEPERLLAVRMLVGAHAGRVVAVTRQQAIDLCDGPIQRAEFVGAAPAHSRDTR